MAQHGIFKCPVCGKRFMSRMAVWTHRKVAKH